MIGAYSHAFTWDVPSFTNYKSPANRPCSVQNLATTRLIAMQKVVGSNPISRFSSLMEAQREMERQPLAGGRTALTFRAKRQRTPGRENRDGGGFKHEVWRVSSYCS
jgi:hypothetical protein